ncbi:hypothetical protein M409DRAFT_54618 [Zasmidium cellare ATCC 36951]|uniref:Extracellular membrane protein CFEM domain-containing protein n=1 Tax=Zasmidium cellare ATCC 36951 TaxID=1080233 RepID=A0A6A6CKU7_ZASCE|nr:uncharacterized protein M409DRAFT_54618 [Zasmidium cellare ATCC 36951]KAF2166838.1 hypothetical protein M409DRAFT_54618 [Zasmidium cellare ATCC 36951]
MHVSQALLLAIAGLAAAQTSTTSAAASTSSAAGTSGCGSQIDDIIASCLGTTQTQLDACTTNDWDCMCEQSNNVLTCYNNCPSDPRRNGIDQQNVSYCNAAKAYVYSHISQTVHGIRFDLRESA